MKAHLKEAQNNESLCSLLRSAPTRWGTIHAMCDVVLVVACRDAGKSDLLRQHDMRRVEGLMMTAMLPIAN